LRYAGWRVVLTCFLIALFLFGFGLYGHGVYVAELQRLRGWPPALISGASTLSFLISNISATFTNEFLNRFGPRRLILMGMTALAASTTLLAFATVPWQLYAAFILMAFGWIGMGTVVIATIVSAWFFRRRGLAISLAFNGASFGGVIVAPLLVFLVETMGFTAAMLATTAIMLVVLVPVVLAWIGPPPPAGNLAKHRSESSLASQLPRDQTHISRAMVLRRPAFWTISLPFALALIAQVGLIVHQIALLEPKIGRNGAGLAVALTTFMAVAGRICLGVIIDRLNPRWVTAASLVSQAAALLAIMQSDNALTVFAACAIFGFSVGNLITLPPLIIHREFEASAFAVVMGLSTAMTGTIGALGPGLVGLVRAWSDDYGVALALCVCLELTAAMIVLGSGKKAGIVAE
jgi:MFS family permease